jgi:hypothetical protein
MLSTDDVQFFKSHLSEMMESYPGRYVIIHDQRVVSTCDSFETALAEAAARYYPSPFLVQHIDPGVLKGYLDPSYR